MERITVAFGKGGSTEPLYEHFKFIRRQLGRDFILTGEVTDPAVVYIDPFTSPEILDYTLSQWIEKEGKTQTVQYVIIDLGNGEKLIQFPLHGLSEVGATLEYKIKAFILSSADFLNEHVLKRSTNRSWIEVHVSGSDLVCDRYDPGVVDRMEQLAANNPVYVSYWAGMPDKMKPAHMRNK